MSLKLDDVVKLITPVDVGVAAAARRRLDSLTKPLGSLGMLEETAVKYATARGDVFAQVRRPAILTFAGDHGVAKKGISAYPPEVTPQMVANFASGGAAINVLSRHAGAELSVIDIGVAAPCEFPGVIQRKVAPGTADFTEGPAMTEEQARKAIEVGIEVADSHISQGSTLLGTGDMGIGNTTPSSAIIALLTGKGPEVVTGRGTGIDDGQLRHKVGVVQRILEVNRPDARDGLDVLAKVGGFEIGGIAGLILGAAARRKPVLVDGFISTAGALIAAALCPAAKGYMVASHLSVEPGHLAMLDTLGKRALLDMNMRLGEGTGSALAMCVVDAAARVLSDVATFAEAAVSGADK
ncbi:MAG: nicotinate-nucleotide--dimethylbenzimidazole phosphoribosyltransferase [Nitrospinae bacterium]|nr:nicotinate-nucleotide--dimethylbenzimidazole phosphoribosyltransferase [Nitrospinota bacterium]